MLNQVLDAGEHPIRFDDTVLRELADILEVTVLLVWDDRVVGGSFLQLVVVAEELLAKVFSDIAPLLMEVRGNAAQVGSNQLVLLAVLEQIANKCLAGLPGVDLEELSR